MGKNSDPILTKRMRERRKAEKAARKQAKKAEKQMAARTAEPEPEQPTDAS